jgi:hypothetical protein
MLIRFLAPNNECYQIDSAKTPILIYFENKDEIKKMKKMVLGECLTSIPTPLNALELSETLRSTKEPKNLK